jgi:ubiquinone/menaquinone biosynthesis C-methylase UbiE
MRISLLPTLVREIAATRSLPREPEPALVMDDEEQVKAYALAGRIDGVMAAAYLFHSAHICSVLSGCATALDLGCGPATQLAQIAGLNPDVQFTGIDLSGTMLRDAEEHLRERGIANATLSRDDISQLSSLNDHSFDAVISTMALHHLPNLAALRSTFQQIRRVLKPKGALYLVDFGRLKSLKSVIFFAYLNRQHQPHIFSLDYERSLRAAFLPDEFKALAREELPEAVEVFATFLVPILTVIKTRDRGLRDEQRQKLKMLRNGLSSQYRRDLDEMRRFFRLGGMRFDPFSA